MWKRDLKNNYIYKKKYEKKEWSCKALLLEKVKVLQLEGAPIRS